MISNETMHMSLCENLQFKSWYKTTKKISIDFNETDVMCTVHFFRGIPPSTEKLLQLFLKYTAEFLLKMTVSWKSILIFL